MIPLPIARLALATFACCLAVTPTFAFAAGGMLQPPSPIHLGPPQWTFNVPINVNHMTSQFVAVGALCTVSALSGPPVGEGVAVDKPLSGGAFSGTESVPVYLANGMLATQAKYWACVIIFRDTAGKLHNPSQESTDKVAQPNPQMPSMVRVVGDF